MGPSELVDKRLEVDLAKDREVAPPTGQLQRLLLHTRHDSDSPDPGLPISREPTERYSLPMVPEYTPASGVLTEDLGPFFK